MVLDVVKSGVRTRMNTSSLRRSDQSAGLPNPEGCFTTDMDQGQIGQPARPLVMYMDQGQIGQPARPLVMYMDQGQIGQPASGDV